MGLEMSRERIARRGNLISPEIFKVKLRWLDWFVRILMKDSFSVTCGGLSPFITQWSQA
jgi:hypothetical protein